MGLDGFPHTLRPWLAHPPALVLMGVMPALGLVAVWAARRRRRALLRLGGLAALEQLVAAGGWLAWLRTFCLSTGMSFLVLGIAGPQWGRDWGQSAASGRDIVVVLDQSRSMYAEDVLPNRLGQAQEAVTDLVEKTVRPRGGHRLALVVFAAKAETACPLTHDYDHFLEVLHDLDLKQPPARLLPEVEGRSGTRFGAALLEALKAHDPRFPGHQDVLLVSDGDDPGQDSAGERHRAVTQARERRVRVHVVGLGDPDEPAAVPFDYPQPVTSKLQEGPLRDIARSTGGTYVPAQRKAVPLGRLFRECVETQDYREHSDDALPVYQQRYGWFLGGALAFLSLDLLLGRRGKKFSPKDPPAAVIR